MRLSKTLNLIRKSQLNSSQGFSLVELMVVVAIIGILASIAIPNYQKFRRRSMQVEPKAVMSGMYTNQVVFSSEWNHLTADFQQLGFNIANQESTRYRTGWAAGSEYAGQNTPTTYQGPPQATSPVFSIEPTQCVTGTRCNDAALIKAFNDAGAYATGSTADTCTGGSCTCTGGSASCTGTGACNGTCGFWADGELKERAPNLQFVIGSAGDIGGSKADIWHMAFNKNIKMIQNGVD